MAWYFHFERMLTGLNTVTVFFKYFKSTRVIKRLSILVHVLWNARRAILSFFSVIMVLLFGFVLQFYLAYGHFWFQYV